MFNLNPQDVRKFFFDTFARGEGAKELTALEKLAYSIILEHPEYRKFLQDQEKYLDYQWLPENGETNPFLHMSMHLSILEQLSINQPPGISELFNQLYKKYSDNHEASHQLIDCLGEMLWQAQRNHSTPDINVYFDCINKKLGKI